MDSLCGPLNKAYCFQLQLFKQIRFISHNSDNSHQRSVECLTTNHRYRGQPETVSILCKLPPNLPHYRELTEKVIVQRGHGVGIHQHEDRGGILLPTVGNIFTFHLLQHLSKPNGIIGKQMKKNKKKTYFILFSFLPLKHVLKVTKKLPCHFISLFRKFYSISSTSTLRSA